MEKTTICTIKNMVQYIVPATAIVLIQIYYKKTWIWLIQTFSLFFGSILSWIMLTDFLKIILEINFPMFMEQYWWRLDYFLVWFSVIVWFYMLLFLFAKEEIFEIFNKIKKWK
jgi:hypothetical protein